jgi:hypothetical protein
VVKTSLPPDQNFPSVGLELHYQFVSALLFTGGQNFIAMWSELNRSDQNFTAVIRTLLQ